MKRKMPLKQREAIKANRDMLGAIASCFKRALKRRNEMEKRHGPLSEEALAADYGYRESDQLLKTLYRIVERRLYDLEAPFRKEP